jgi:hypothetical protein
MFPERALNAIPGPAEKDGATAVPVLPAQYVELLETVWACERAWRVEDRIDLAVRYGTPR